MLRFLGSTLAIVSLSLMSPVKSVSKVLRRLNGPLGLLPLHYHAYRQARRHMRTRAVDRRSYQVARAYLCAPDSPVALERLDNQVHQDYVTGCVAVVDYWVISETELALLALINRPL